MKKKVENKNSNNINLNTVNSIPLKLNDNYQKKNKRNLNKYRKCKYSVINSE